MPLIEKSLEVPVLPVVAGAVQFEVFKQKQQLFEMLCGQAIIDGIQRMGNDVEDFLPVNIGAKVEDILAPLLDFAVLGLTDIQSQHMHFATVLWKIRGHFLANERPRKMGDFQGTIDAVVIGDGHMGHAASSGDMIKMNTIEKR
jgi:hypothetical protein